MSKTELLTKTEDAEAAKQGWSLNHVYDLTTKQWRVMVLGNPNASTASQHVINLARMNSALHQKALGLVMASNLGK